MNFPVIGWGQMDLKGIGRDESELEKFVGRRIEEMQPGEIADYLCALGVDVRLRRPTAKALERRKAEHERWKRARAEQAAKTTEEA